jgi:hypothetical protein
LPDSPWYTYTKTGNNIPNDPKELQIAIHYTKMNINIPNGHDMCQFFNVPKLSIICMRIFHLATLSGVSLNKIKLILQNGVNGVMRSYLLILVRKYF